MKLKFGIVQHWVLHPFKTRSTRRCAVAGLLTDITDEIWCVCFLKRTPSYPFFPKPLFQNCADRVRSWVLVASLI